MSSTPEMIRKAAIVIASLDEAAADRLLDGMSEELAAQVRWMSVELDDISDDERQSVLDEFLKRSGRQVASAAGSPSDPGVEMQFTCEQPAATSQPPKTDTPSNSPTPPPFAFLNDAPTEMLAPFFEQEHPQVTAVVMSFLPPTRASEILTKLPTKLQADIVHRITQLDEPSQEIVADIEARIQQIVSRQTQSHQRRRVGLAAAQAILQASSGDQAQELLQEIRDRNAQLSQELEATETNHTPTIIPFPAPTLKPQAPTISVASTPVAESASQQVPSDPAPRQPEAPKPKPAAAALPAAKFPFEQFARLDDHTLASVLQIAGPKVVLLALCGASPAVMKRFSRGLGTGDVKRLEQKIRQMQPVLLSDIDRAKRKMCLAADQVRDPSASPSLGQLQAIA